MARKDRDPRAEKVAQAIYEAYEPKTAEEMQDALKQVFGPMIETMLSAELEAHLGYASNERGPKETPNRRNGYTPKKVRSSLGEFGISVPRDRDGSFEPVAVPKGQRDVSGLEERVVAMYGRGMSQRDISKTVQEIYGISLSAETVSKIADSVWDELQLWRSRPLEPVYAFAFVDCLFVNVRRGRAVEKAAVYVMLAYDLQGRKDILGIWIGESEGASRWLEIFDELRGRGVEDVLFMSMDGLSGLEDAARAAFPECEVQRCIAHLVRNSAKYVPNKDTQAFCKQARGFYGAPSLEAARDRFAQFKEDWAKYPGAVRVWERNFEHVERLFRYGRWTRKMMYTTNAVESVNSSFRKVTKRGAFYDDDSVLKLFYLRVRELYSAWGEGCHQSHWADVRNELRCDESMMRRVRKYCDDW